MIPSWFDSSFGKSVYDIKIIVAYLKDFLSRVDWHFRFLNVFFRFGDINVFVLYKLAT